MTEHKHAIVLHKWQVVVEKVLAVIAPAISIALLFTPAGEVAAALAIIAEVITGLSTVDGILNGIEAADDKATAKEKAIAILSTVAANLAGLLTMGRIKDKKLKISLITAITVSIKVVENLISEVKK